MCIREKRRLKKRRWCYSTGLDSLLLKTLMFTLQKTEPLSQVIILKTLRLNEGLKLSNAKLGRRESAVHLFVKQIPPIDSCHQVDSDRCNFRLLMPALALFSMLQCWEDDNGLNCHAAWQHRKSTICTSMICG